MENDKEIVSGNIEEEGRFLDSDEILPLPVFLTKTLMSREFDMNAGSLEDILKRPIS
jgi:hypothetical protein